LSRNFELGQKALSGPVSSEVPWVPRIADREPTHYPPTVVVSRPEPEWVRALEVLRQRWKAGAAFAVVVISAVTLGTFLMKSIYEPVARLQIDPPGNEIFSIQEKSNVENGTEYINTQANNLKNDGFLLEVIRKLNLAAVPEFGGGNASDSRAPIGPTEELTLTKPESRALMQLQKQTSVTRDAGSRLLQVSVASHDPRRAAQITNTVVDLFVEREYRMRHDSIMASSVSLQKQLADIWARMEESNRVLAAFQKSNDLAIVGNNQSTFSEQFAELNRQYMQAEADRIQLQSYLKNFDGHSASSLPQVNSNPVIQQLTQKQAEVRAELSQTLAVYGKHHPKVRELENKANELDAQLQQQRASILSGLQTSYSAEKARSQLMKSAMQSTTKQLAMMTRYNELRKEADANTQLYNDLYAKIKEAGIAAESKSSPIRIVERARVLDIPTRPHRMMNIAVGSFGGIVGGLVLVFLLEGFGTKIRTLEDIRQCIGTSPVSVLPEILSDQGSNFSRLLPFGSGATEHPLFLVERPSAPESQALRALYSSLRFVHGAMLPQVLVVASPHSGEGKTTLSVNLAVALAEHGDICLVDADMRKPDIAAALGLRSNFGLSDVLQGTASLDQVLIPVPAVPNLTVLPAGLPYEDAAKLIFSDSLSELIRQLRGRFRFVLIDSPPVVPFADARVLSVLADGVILVGRSGVTKREALSRAVELLRESHSAPILQTVLNAAEYPSVDYHQYYGSAKNAGYRKRATS
jgi:succinoglycan biosynthesis transport protein ExoP